MTALGGVVDPIRLAPRQRVHVSAPCLRARASLEVAARSRKTHSAERATFTAASALNTRPRDEQWNRLRVSLSWRML